MDTTNDLAAAETLLRGNIETVFNERDATKRLAAIARLWSAEPIMFEPGEILAVRDDLGVGLSAAGEPAGRHAVYASWPRDRPSRPLHSALAGRPAAQLPHTLGRDVAVLKDGAIDHV